MTKTLSFILAATLATACATGQGNIEYGSPVISSNPELVEISPGVDVVAGTREPVFRTNNAYWLYRGDRWYRSDDLGDTWVRIATPPRAIATITEPNWYANYRAETRTPEDRGLEARRPEQPRPQAPYPRPPQQVPPAVPDDPGSTDQVPRDPTLPAPQGTAPTPTPPEPDDLGRPDRMRDR